jgi:hypothetical protein
MAQVEKFYFLHQLFKSRNDDCDPLIPVSRTTGNRMIQELVRLGEIPEPPRVAGRAMIPESSVQKLIEFIQRGGFADLRVNDKSAA